MRTHAETVAALGRADLEVRAVPGIEAAITPWGARLISLAFAPDAPNLLWTHPSLYENSIPDVLKRLSGGLGGDRVWLSPETDFHWRGAPDWHGFTNNSVPAAIDPGAYAFEEGGPDEVVLGQEAIVPTTAGGQVTVRVRKSLRAMSAPPAVVDCLDGVEFVGVEAWHEIHLLDAVPSAKVALWRLLQLHPGACAVVPLAAGEAVAPLAYSPRPGAWELHSDHLAWRYRGEGAAKIGLGCGEVTGRACVVQPLGKNRHALLVRQFPVLSAGCYADRPFGSVRDDQVLQLWDGFGFGELEHHSGAVASDAGTREVTMVDALLAFSAPGEALLTIAARLVGIDIQNYL